MFYLMTRYTINQFYFKQKVNWTVLFQVQERRLWHHRRTWERKFQCQSSISRSRDGRVPAQIPGKTQTTYWAKPRTESKQYKYLVCVSVCNRTYCSCSTRAWPWWRCSTRQRSMSTYSYSSLTKSFSRNEQSDALTVQSYLRFCSSLFFICFDFKTTLHRTEWSILSVLWCHYSNKSSFFMLIGW